MSEADKVIKSLRVLPEIWEIRVSSTQNVIVMFLRLKKSGILTSNYTEILQSRILYKNRALQNSFTSLGVLAPMMAA